MLMCLDQHGAARAELSKAVLRLRISATSIQNHLWLA